MRCRRRAVDRDLNAVDRKRRDPVGGSVVDPATIGLDLERDPGGGKDFEEFPAVRDAERLTAAEGDVRNPEVDAAPCEVERLVASKLVVPRVVGAGFLAAGDAARAAAVRQLPGEKKGRSVLIDRAPRIADQLRLR